VREFSEALDAARCAGNSVGLVPTMGALHAGHRALVERAALENDVVAVTIFVNPLQFGDPQDIAHYPRTLDHDLEVCEAAGASVVFAPTVEEMYPDGAGGSAVTVSVHDIGAQWEGASRPGHFDGVATVVTKLFAMAGRCRAYFGEKDFQQLALVRRLAAGLCLPVEVVGCVTVREPDGLALSSRNVRLACDERRAATVLSRALRAGDAALRAGATHPAEVVGAMVAEFDAEPLAHLDYAAVVDAGDLTVPASLDTNRPLRLIVAAQVGPVRLIDNCPGTTRQATPRRAALVAAVTGAATGSDDGTHHERIW
jgi:pantoate--beta-alanine ligase